MNPLFVTIAFVGTFSTIMIIHSIREAVGRSHRQEEIPVPYIIDIGFRGVQVPDAMPIEDLV